MNLVKSQDTKLIHRNVLHCYTLKKKKKRSEREIKKTFTTATTTKYLGINLKSLLILFHFFSHAVLGFFNLFIF